MAGLRRAVAAPLLEPALPLVERAVAVRRFVAADVERAEAPFDLADPPPDFAAGFDLAFGLAPFGEPVLLLLLRDLDLLVAIPHPLDRANPCAAPQIPALACGNQT